VGGQMARVTIRTFEIQDCHDMLAKLERELDRVCEVEGTQDRDALADHGINFALTAWHMGTWVWADVRRRYDIRAEIAAAMKLEVKALAQEVFEDFLVRERSLRYCRQIAVSFKHIGVDRWEGDTDARGIFSAQSTHPAKLPSDVPFQIEMQEFVDSPPNWHIKIVDGEARHSAIEIFREAVDFWRGFIIGRRLGHDEAAAIALQSPTTG
jgi:hypothetical protein